MQNTMRDQGILEIVLDTVISYAPSDKDDKNSSKTTGNFPRIFPRIFINFLF